jgi:RNA polymerase sigma-70 factor (ECF subfamily)
MHALTADDATISDLTSPSQHLESKETFHLLLNVLATLPASQQECIRLKFQQHMSYQQISQVTGLSVTNVGYLIHVGIKSLREHFVSPTADTVTGTHL